MITIFRAIALPASLNLMIGLTSAAARRLPEGATPKGSMR